jgi:hypothetical protein
VDYLQGILKEAKIPYEIEIEQPDENVIKQFKQEKFLDDAKHPFTDIVNLYKDANDSLKVFDKNGVYIPVKKIGKNNPKEEQKYLRLLNCDIWIYMVNYNRIKNLS